MNTPNTQILVSNTILQQRDLTVFGEMAVLGLREEVLKMNVETLVMPGRMKMLKKKKKKRKRPTKIGVKSKGHRNQCKEFPVVISETK